MNNKLNNLKIGFHRTAKSKNALHYPWLSRFNNDGTHVVNENPIEWEKKTIKEFFTHIKEGTFGRNFTIADFMKSYKPVLFSKGKKKVDVFHLEFLDQLIEQSLNIKDERDDKAEIISVIEDQNWRALDSAMKTFDKRNIENYKTELEEKWIGAKVKDRDFGVVEITDVTITTKDWDQEFGIVGSEVEFKCYDEKSGDSITFDLFYAEDNLVEEENEVDLV